jgi:hypothetical protein
MPTPDQLVNLEDWNNYVQGSVDLSFAHLELSERDIKRLSKTFKRLLTACPSLYQGQELRVDGLLKTHSQLQEIGQSSLMDFKESLTRV